MKVFKYRPEEFGETFKGEIDIEIPTYKERITLAQSLKITEQNSLEKVSDLADIVEKRIKSVNVVHTATGQIFNSVEDLGYTKEGSTLLNELGALIFNGIPLGKN